MNQQKALALDAMGGDLGPTEIVKGGVDYARATGDKVLLVGQREPVEAALRACGGGDAPVEIVVAADVVEFSDKITAIRAKRDSSIHVGTRLVRDGLAQGFVSAGHTGAVMFVSKVVYGVLEGVDRPALPAPLPRIGPGYTVLVDAGANVDCEVEHLRQFAVMGMHYARRIFGVENPRVALLSIGEEDSKGNEILRGVAPILRAANVNFVGNVEGNDLLTDKADVVVCDGFVGNVALKVGEGIAESIMHIIREEAARHLTRRIGAALMLPAFRSLKKKIDYAETGGVPLLGLKAISVVSHGRSSAKAITNALRVAREAHVGNMVGHMENELRLLHQAERRLAS
ncbi:MAG: phosphate acyltransferase PlsX [Acidobacteria bacterium]|nr:phosphate acyltransferase PlsX [Acidobacteriota bacterium]